MTLPTTGTLTMTQIAAEIGISPTGLSLNDSRVRTLAGKPSGAISYSDLRGKSWFTVGLTGGSTLYANDGDGTCTQAMGVQTDGTIVFTVGTSARWGSPTTAGIGSSYWVKFTQTATSQTGTGSGSATATTAWLQLTTARSVQVSATKSGSTGTKITNATYTIQIATDSAGSNIVATATGYQLRATAAPI